MADCNIIYFPNIVMFCVCSHLFLCGQWQHLFPHVSWVSTFVSKWPMATFYVLGCLHLTYFQESSIPNMNQTSTLQTKSGLREHNPIFYHSLYLVPRWLVHSNAGVFVFTMWSRLCETHNVYDISLLRSNIVICGASLPVHRSCTWFSNNTKQATAPTQVYASI